VGGEVGFLTTAVYNRRHGFSATVFVATDRGDDVGQLSMKFCWAQYLLWLVIALLGLGSMMTACGQKGDLYRPAETAAPSSATR